MWHFVSSLLISVLLFVFITFRQLTKLSCWSTRRVGSVLMNVRKMLSFFFFPEMLPALLSSNFVKHSLWYWGSCNFSKTPSKLSLSWTIVGLKNFGSSPQNCSCTRWRTFRPSCCVLRFYHTLVCRLLHKGKLFAFLFFLLCTKYGKSVPLQARMGPEGSRNLRFPDFVTMAQDGGRLSA